MVTRPPIMPVKIFYSYAHEDKLLKDKLDDQLGSLMHLGWISSWHDREVNSAMEWEYEIDEHLDSADIILLLISPDFMASDYVYGIEVQRAMERHDSGEAIVIPIILRPSEYVGAPFGKVQVLPKNAKPISLWSNRADAFYMVEKGIREAVRRLLPRKISEYDVIVFDEFHLFDTASLLLKEKYEAGTFDVFLCHNNKDKSAVKKIGEQLKKRGILPWLDEWELRPGFPWQRLLEEQIEQIKSAAVFVGKDGVGPWQRQEMDAFLREFANRGCPVIPVLLEYAPSEPKLPLFLRGITWVDFRELDPNPMKQLIWGITGERDLL